MDRLHFKRILKDYCFVSVFHDFFIFWLHFKRILKVNQLVALTGNPIYACISKEY